MPKPPLVWACQNRFKAYILAVESSNLLLLAAKKTTICYQIFMAPEFRPTTEKEWEVVDSHDHLRLKVTRYIKKEEKRFTKITGLDNEERGDREFDT